MLQRVSTLLLTFCITATCFFCVTEKAFAYDKPGMSDFKMGMTEAEVAAILDSKYGMQFEDNPSFGARYIPTAENPYGKLTDRDAFFGDPDIEGIVAKGCSVKGRAADNGFMTFIFADNALIQTYVHMLQVPNAEIVKKLQAIYGGDVQNFPSSISLNPHYVGKGENMVVFMRAGDYDGVIITYSADNADSVIKAKVDAMEAKIKEEEQKKLDAAGSKL